MVGVDNIYEDDDDLIALMKRSKIPLTRENYLDLAYGREKPEEWGAELEDNIPSRFQQPIKTVD